jgi:protein ImuA
LAKELRRLLPLIEAAPHAPVIPFDVPLIDRCLPQGGLPRGALHEIAPENGGLTAALGFIVALLVRLDEAAPPEQRDNNKVIIFVMPGYGVHDQGRLHGHGLKTLGLDPGRVIMVGTTNRKDQLWAMEEAVRSGAPAAVVGVIDTLDLKQSQRLQLAARDAGLPLFLLRPAQILEASAAATRWRVAPAPAVRDRFGLHARACWHLLLERCRNGRAGEWTVEYDHVAHRFSLAAALAGPAFPRRRGPPRGGRAG